MQPRIKLNEEALGKDLIGDIIESIEDEPVKDLNWIDSVIRIQKKAWKLTIKNKAKYYPKSIKKYAITKHTLTIEGSLYQIEENIRNIWEKTNRNISL